MGKRLNKTKKAISKDGLLFVGAPGFEPGTPCSQSRCATGLRYAPNFVPIFVGAPGFEPETLPIRSGCATGLRYAPKDVCDGVGVQV